MAVRPTADRRRAARAGQVSMCINDERARALDSAARQVRHDHRRSVVDDLPFDEFA
jgi:hypothetical protein